MKEIIKIVIYYKCENCEHCVNDKEYINKCTSCGKEICENCEWDVFSKDILCDDCE